MIEFPCECGQQLRVADEQRGLPVLCPTCGRQQTVPGGTQITADRPDDRLDPTPDDRPRRPRRLDEGPDDWPRDRKPAKSNALLYTMIALGVCALVGCVACVPVALLLPAVQKVRGAAARMSSTNNLKQIGLAMDNYHDGMGRYPLAYDLVDAGGAGPKKDGMSWRIAILPYIEQAPLYSQYVSQQPWDSPANQGIQAFAIKTYRDPGDPSSAPTTTDYQVFVSALGKTPHSMFNDPHDSRNFVKMTDVTDGTSNTILVAEAPNTVPWYTPQDMAFDPSQPPPALGQHHAGGSLVVMADASTKFLPKSFNPTTLKQVITRDGSEQIVDPDW